MTAVLSVSHLRMQFGGLVAVDEVSFDANQQEIFAIIGPNGAGKTTVFNCISGFYPPTAGNIVLNGQQIDGRVSHIIARKGLTRTFQNIRLFADMTVLENLMVAQHHHANRNLLSGLLKTKAYVANQKQLLENAKYWLEQVGLIELANVEAGNLAYGQQRRLEIARCMATKPKVLMLDEPAAGLNPSETDDLNALIRRLRDQQAVTIVLIEHDMRLVMNISDRVLVLDQGRPIVTGTPTEVQGDERVIKAYLGEEAV